MYSCLRDMLTLVMLTASSSSLLAQVIDIKLNCQISLTTSYSTGAREQEQLSEIFDVYQNFKSLAISATTSNFASVHTGNLPGLSFTNLSDENKWDLTNQKADFRSQIVIVRNTGQIFYHFNFKTPSGIIALQQGNGTCRKIDTDKKLF